MQFCLTIFSQHETKILEHRLQQALVNLTKY